METPPEKPAPTLTRAFHEPNRLQILSALATAPHGLTFREIKDRCQLTDGNLSRHMKTLEEAGAVRIEKAFVNSKPRTTLFLSDEGRRGFIEYIETLEKVLHQARAATGTTTSALPPASQPRTQEEMGGSHD